jgi:hypothetical protein
LLLIVNADAPQPMGLQGSATSLVLQCLGSITWHKARQVPVELTGRVGNGRTRKALGRFSAGVLIGVIGNLVCNTIPHDLNWFHSNHFKNKKRIISTT